MTATFQASEVWGDLMHKTDDLGKAQTPSPCGVLRLCVGLCPTRHSVDMCGSVSFPLDHRGSVGPSCAVILVMLSSQGGQQETHVAG